MNDYLDIAKHSIDMQIEFCETMRDIFIRNTEKLFEMQKSITNNQIKAYQENMK